VSGGYANDTSSLPWANLFLKFSKPLTCSTLLLGTCRKAMRLGARQRGPERPAALRDRLAELVLHHGGGIGSGQRILNGEPRAATQPALPQRLRSFEHHRRAMHRVDRILPVELRVPVVCAQGRCRRVAACYVCQAVDPRARRHRNMLAKRGSNPHEEWSSPDFESHMSERHRL
jgi:hypothetical protein